MELDLEVDGAVATLRLNRPEKLNAVTPAMWDLFVAHCDRIEADPAIRAVVLTGAGRAFCAGADTGGAAGSTSFGVADAMGALALVHRAVLRLYHLRKPVVAAVRGHAVGIGWNLALCADLLIASDTAQFCQVFLNRGIGPDGASTFLLSRQVGMFRAKEILYSRRMVGAQEACALGLANRVVPDAELDAAALAQARELAEGPTFALGQAKRLFQTHAANLEDFLEKELTTVVVITQSEDRVEGVTAAKEKRKPRFKGR